MRRSMWICVAVLMSAFPNLLSAHPVQASGEAKYLGNEGVMISDRNSKIMFDPFFHEDFGTFQLVPEEMKAAIMAGDEPFEGMTAIFVSHAHDDHFTASTANEYMLRHPAVHIVAPVNAVEEMMASENWDHGYKDRIIQIDLAVGDDPFSFNLEELQVTAIRIPHTGWPERLTDLPNIVYHVRMADQATVMHLGDASTEESLFTPYTDFWAENVTDLGMVPYWFYLVPGGKVMLKQLLNMNSHIGIHVPVEVPVDLGRAAVPFFSTPGDVQQIFIYRGN